jgi:hypothetical protein
MRCQDQFAATDYLIHVLSQVSQYSELGGREIYRLSLHSDLMALTVYR